MKCVEIVLNGLNETNHILSDFEIKLASFGEMPSELEALKTVTSSDWSTYTESKFTYQLRICVFCRFIKNYWVCRTTFQCSSLWSTSCWRMVTTLAVWSRNHAITSTATFITIWIVWIVTWIKCQFVGTIFVVNWLTGEFFRLTILCLSLECRLACAVVDSGGKIAFLQNGKKCVKRHFLLNFGRESKKIINLENFCFCPFEW